MSINIKFKIKDNNSLFKIPEYATPGSSGLDLYSTNKEEITILPGGVELIDTNLCIEMPDNMEAQIRSRSGLSLKNHIFVLNGVGTIDSSYRGSIGIILANFGPSAFIIKPQMKIAQLVFSNVLKVNLIADDLSETQRSNGGFGSTGI
jgi:dUTP pyrophosphatase